jgi:hypothetical protein
MMHIDDARVVARGCDLPLDGTALADDLTHFILNQTRSGYGHSGDLLDQRTLNNRLLEALQDLRQRLAKIEAR